MERYCKYCGGLVKSKQMLMCNHCKNDPAERIEILDLRVMEKKFLYPPISKTNTDIEIKE